MGAFPAPHGTISSLVAWADDRYIIVRTLGIRPCFNPFSTTAAALAVASSTDGVPTATARDTSARILQ